jgi:UDP-N-acetyl-D-galactosamine dehydrogenase
VLGLTFKEICPDLLNTRAIDIVRELQSAHANVDVFDPWADGDEAEQRLGIRPVAQPLPQGYDAIVLAVAHQAFLDLGDAGLRAFGHEHCAVFDVKSLLAAETVDGRL